MKSHSVFVGIAACWLCCFPLAVWAQSTPAARPSSSQHYWHEQERIMFVCLDPCTWQGREYDNHSTPLSEIDPKKLDTDQWCRAALSWGAKEILFVAKHTGGFCWWQTDTTEYSIGNTAYKDGKGDIIADLSASCKKYDLNLGIYIYPGDDTWGAGMGSGGKTGDPAKQAAYNKILRQQWTEVLSRYGRIVEIWFDGSCVVPLGDIIEKHAPEAAIFQGPHATIRWPGTESGILPYPAWNSLTSKDLKTGVATARHGNPDGDAWAPLEADTTLYNHHWFWSEAKEKKRKSLKELLNIYYKSVGRGGVLLLNSTPNTDGLIPTKDMRLYQQFGEELARRFDNPLAQINGRGMVHTIKFDKPTKVNQLLFMEDYRLGERIRRYVVEVRGTDGKWRQVNRGSSVGRKRIIVFEPQEVTRISLRIAKSVNTPLIRSMKAYYIDGMDCSYLIDKDMSKPLSAGSTATTNDYHSEPYTADKINDGNMRTRWGTHGQTKKCWVELDLGAEKTVGKTAIYELADRVRKFRIEYRSDKTQPWKVCLQDTVVGNEYSREFVPVSGRYFRLNILEATFAPTIWEFQLFENDESGNTWDKCYAVKPRMFKDNAADVAVDLSPFIKTPGQYLVRFDNPPKTACMIDDIRLFYNGKPVLAEMLTTIKAGELYNINRTAQIIESSVITLKMKLRTENPGGVNADILIKKAIE